MKSLFANLFVVGSFAVVGASANAYVCSSVPNQFGGTQSVSVTPEADGKATIEFYAQGGMAHFIMQSGPMQATAAQFADGTVYTFVDSTGAENTLSVMTSPIGGKLETTAATNYGIWKTSNLICK